MRRSTVRRPFPAAVAAVTAAATLLLAGCTVDTTEEPLPTGGEITGDTSVIETPTGEATE